ncbi:TetR/AcrR family transcriptional regulator [Microaceticoccus formicicus]|uniref:TetR/AcrR family transcriptional regulator n=1 Tax=Microaceticoccus formicicus TaxID=3118105 RepID=UPI003CD021FC|nr:TetR/AcrR family transcriptional regulator [Peptoniphilaceae bacterium AMB_02]
MENKMNGYEKRTQRKKESILLAATDLFLQRGISDVSIVEIAASAKVSQVSIYNYFGDKNNLAKQVFIHYINRIVSEYDELLDSNLPFSEKLEQIMLKKQSAILSMTESNFGEQALKDQTLRDIYAEASSIQATSIYKKFIQVGKEAGAIDPTISNEAILDYLLSSASIMRQSDYYQTSAKYKEDILKLFLYGIIKK